MLEIFRLLPLLLYEGDGPSNRTFYIMCALGVICIVSCLAVIIKECISKDKVLARIFRAIAKIMIIIILCFVLLIILIF